MVGVNSNSLEQKSRIQSALITLGVQVLLFLAIYFIVVWEQPDPPKPTYGMELNLGFSDLGAGDQALLPTTTSEITAAEAPAPGEVVTTPQAVAITTSKATSSKPSTYQAVSTQSSPIKGETTANDAPAKEEQKEETKSSRATQGGSTGTFWSWRKVWKEYQFECFYRSRNFRYQRQSRQSFRYG